MSALSTRLPLRSRLLPALYQAHEDAGCLDADAVARIASHLKLPVAEAWAVATAYPEFRFDGPRTGTPVCTGLACALAGAAPGPGAEAIGCLFRCYEAPATGTERLPTEAVVQRLGPLLAPDIDDDAGLDAARRMPRDAVAETVAQAGLRGRGGAYFPVARKWRTALDQGRPVALVMNAEEGEPGVFKDRTLLALRPRRVLEGLAIAAEVLSPAVTIVFLNGAATGVRAGLERLLGEAGNGSGLFGVEIYSGGGGYVLGEDTTLINAIEGRKPVPRPRPPYPAESGLFGMPTVVSNVETFAALSVVLREGPDAYRQSGSEAAPGTKLFSVTGRVARPGVYEFPLGTPVAEIADSAGAERFGALVGGPSGGFLPASAFDRPLDPGLLDDTGAVTGSGGLTFLRDLDDVRLTLDSMTRFNADESCGKCTPCREGTLELVKLVDNRDGREPAAVTEVVREASLCGLGQMATGPLRSAMKFWPEMFA